MLCFHKLVLPASLLFAVTVHSQASLNDSLAWSSQLIRIEQQLLDDIPAGNTNNWNKYLHKGFFIVTEDGTLLNRQAFLATFHTLPKGYSGYIKLIHPKAVFYGNTAVIEYISDEYENVFESGLHTQYSSMNTYIKADTSWQMISSQVFEIPLLPPAVHVPMAILQKYTGLYRLSDSITCRISLEQDTLYYQRTGRPKTALLAETETIFFRSSDARGRKLFVIDEKGTAWMKERRNGQDVVWKRVQKG